MSLNIFLILIRSDQIRGLRLLHYIYILHYNLHSFARIISRLTSLSPYIHPSILHLPYPNPYPRRPPPKSPFLSFLLYPHPHPHPTTSKQKQKQKRKKTHTQPSTNIPPPHTQAEKAARASAKAARNATARSSATTSRASPSPPSAASPGGGASSVSLPVSLLSLNPLFSTSPFYPFTLLPLSPFIPFFHHSLTHSLPLPGLPACLPTLIIISLTYTHTISSFFSSSIPAVANIHVFVPPRSDLRRNPRCPQDLPRGRHPRRRHVHGAREAQDGHEPGRRVRAQAPREDAVWVRRLSKGLLCCWDWTGGGREGGRGGREGGMNDYLTE